MAPERSEEAPGAGAAGEERFSPAYRGYVLGLLFLAYVFNFIDRQILSILLEPIKRDLGASDTMMGFLTGIAFALFYTVMGIPIARFADRGVRRSVIAAGIAVWSAMTAVSGLVRTSGQLALARIGVGVGEAALSPPAHSLLADYFPPHRRATALSIYSMGIHVGIMFGFVAGGWINEFFGWRVAFFVVGLPGLLVALLVRLTVREPERGYGDESRDEREAPSVREVFRFLWALRSFRHFALAGALTSFAGYGLAMWGPAFLIRVHGMSTGEAGTWLGLLTGGFGAAGAFLGGALSDRLGARDARWYLWIPAIAAAVALPFGAAFLLIPDPETALLLSSPALLVGAMWLGPVFSLTQTVARLRMRSVAAAILFFIINLIGLGLGPQAVGVLNDTLFAGLGAESVRASLLLVIVGMNLWALVHFLLAARTLREDLRAKER